MAETFSTTSRISKFIRLSTKRREVRVYGHGRKSQRDRERYLGTASVFVRNLLSTIFFRSFPLVSTGFPTEIPRCHPISDNCFRRRNSSKRRGSHLELPNFAKKSRKYRKKRSSEKEKERKKEEEKEKEILRRTVVELLVPSNFCSEYI